MSVNGKKIQQETLNVKSFLSQQSITTEKVISPCPASF